MAAANFNSDQLHAEQPSSAQANPQVAGYVFIDTLKDHTVSHFQVSNQVDTVHEKPVYQYKLMLSGQGPVMKEYVNFHENVYGAEGLKTVGPVVMMLDTGYPNSNRSAFQLAHQHMLPDEVLKRLNEVQSNDIHDDVYDSMYDMAPAVQDDQKSHNDENDQKDGQKKTTRKLNVEFLGYYTDIDFEPQGEFESGYPVQMLVGMDLLRYSKLVINKQNGEDDINTVKPVNPKHSVIFYKFPKSEPPEKNTGANNGNNGDNGSDYVDSLQNTGDNSAYADSNGNMGGGSIRTFREEISDVDADSGGESDRVSNDSREFSQ